MTLVKRTMHFARCHQMELVTLSFVQCVHSKTAWFAHSHRRKRIYRLENVLENVSPIGEKQTQINEKFMAVDVWLSCAYF